MLTIAMATLLGGCGGAPTPAQDEVFSGYLRKGFEHSDFYPETDPGLGPWWTVIETESEFEKLEVHARGEGRGRFVTVRLVAKGRLGGPVDFGFRPAFQRSLHVTEVISAQPVTDETFNAVVSQARQRD